MLHVRSDIGTDEEADLFGDDMDDGDEQLHGLTRGLGSDRPRSGEARVVHPSVAGG